MAGRAQRLLYLLGCADSGAPAAAEPISADRLRQGGALRELASAAAFLKDRHAEARRQLEASAPAGQPPLHSMELRTLGVVQARLAHLLQRCSLALGSDPGADRTHLSKNVRSCALRFKEELRNLSSPDPRPVHEMHIAHCFSRCLLACRPTP